MRSGGPQAGPVAEACSCMAMPDADNAGKFTMLPGDDFYCRSRGVFVCFFRLCEVVGMRVTISGIRGLLINSFAEIGGQVYFGCWEKSESSQSIVRGAFGGVGGVEIP